MTALPWTLELVTERTARAIAVVATLLDPQLVVLSGGPAGAGGVLIPRLYEELYRLNSARPRLAASSLAGKAALQGAVRIVLDQALAALLD